MASNNINDFCRFCMKNMRISGVLGHCTPLFDKYKKPLSISDRLMHVGLEIEKRPGKSNRVCRGCVAVLSGLEKYLPVYWRWVENEKDDESCAIGSATNSEKIKRESTPSKTPRAMKRFCHKATSPGINNAITKQKVWDSEESKMMKHINNRKWVAAAKLIMNHKDLAQEVKRIILKLLEKECKTICNPNNNFILWRSSPEDLKSFSFDKLKSDLQRLSPLLFSIFATICQNSSPVICAASAIALRAREPRLSAFAHYLNCVLLYGGAKKAVFDRLSKLAITTARTNAMGKQKELANTCGASLFLFEKLNKIFPTLEAERRRNVGLREDKKSMSPSCEPELIPADVLLSTEELQLSDVRQIMLVKEEAPEEQSAGVDQQDPEHLHIKEEQEELWASLEGEHLQLKEETDAARFPFTVVSVKIEDEENPLFSQLHQQQVEDGDVPTSSADQMTAEAGGEAETSRNPDLNPHQQKSESSETEVSGDEEDKDVNLVSELLDSGPETRHVDDDWIESRSSETDAKTVNKSCSCPKCGKYFLNKWSLQKHVRVTSHSEIRSSGCLVNKECVTLKKHVDPCKKVQTKLKSFSCDDCGKNFSTKSNLNSHINIHTGHKPFACDHCGRMFSLKQHLNTHMRVHTGQKPFACELCGQRFSCKTSLKCHLSIHTGQKPFACRLCGKQFRHKATLNMHMRVHTGQKPFACNLCKQRFSLKHHLNTHMKVHTRQKPFTFGLCGQRFSHKTSLKCHLSIHTGQNPFACELCGKQFCHKATLNMHMSRSHRTEAILL